MFFPEKIKSIRPDDYVLEIGPGAAPHPRSNIFLERTFKNEALAEAQRGFAPKLNTGKKIVYYDGAIFPFQDEEFDYVICSHVIEHISDIESFLKEIFRVAKRGYLEYPLIYYEYIYNVPEHVTYLKFQQGILFYLPKPMAMLSEFSEINRFFQESLKAGHVCLNIALKQQMFEGFEWNEPFTIERAKKISDVCWESIRISPSDRKHFSFISRLKMAVKNMLSCVIINKWNLFNWEHRWEKH